ALCSEIEKCVYINKPWYPSANILIQDRLLKFVERGLDDEQEEKEFGVLNSGRCYKITRDENGEVQLVATKAKRKAKNEEKETEQKEKQKIDFFILFDKKKEVQVVLRELMTVAEETGYIPSEIKCYKALTEKQFDIASNRIRHIQTALSTCVKVVKPTSTSQTLEREKEKNQAARNDEEASCNNESGSGRAVCCSGKEERNKVYNDEKENDDDQRKLERRQQQLGDKPNRKKREVVQLIDALTSTSPLFLLFLDCVYQLIVQNPFLFEFTDDLLIELYCSVCYCCHHTFLFNNVGERLDAMKNCPNHLLLLLLSTFGFSLYLSLKSRLITEKPDERSSSKENEELASFTGKKRSRSKWSTEAAITELLDSNVIFGKRESDMSTSATDIFKLLENEPNKLTELSKNISGDIEKAVLSKKLRTPKSVIHTIDERVRVEEPSQVYRQLVSSTEGVTTVNNSRQVENRRARHLAQFKLSQNEIYSTYKIALDNKSFVKQFILTPNLIIICGHDTGMEMFKQLLKIIKTKIMLSYDTTLQLTDAYVRYTVIWN
ncbi:unnamed protein product, partial [Didymodactylos carnosus]